MSTKPPVPEVQHSDHPFPAKKGPIKIVSSWSSIFRFKATPGASSTSLFAKSSSTGSIPDAIPNRRRYPPHLRRLPNPPKFLTWEISSLHHVFAGMDPNVEDLLHMDWHCPLTDSRYQLDARTIQTLEEDDLFPVPECIPNYDIGRRLMNGQYSSLHLCTNIQSGEIMLMKIIHRSKLTNRQALFAVNRELILGSLLAHRHPYIEGIHSAYESKTHAFLLLPYHANGDLYDYFYPDRARILRIPPPHATSPAEDASSNQARVTSLPGPELVAQTLRGMQQEVLIQGWFRQIVEAVHFLHQNAIVHRDIKLDNFVITSDPRQIRLIDFGLANTYNGPRGLAEFSGSSWYAAPEIVYNVKSPAPPSDIWSLGMSLFMMLGGGHPATSLPPSTATVDAPLEILEKLEMGLDFMPHVRDPAARDLLTRCLHLVPAQRPTTGEILTHAYLRGTDHFAVSNAAEDPCAPISSSPTTTKTMTVLVKYGLSKSLVSQALKSRDPVDAPSPVKAIYRLVEGYRPTPDPK